ncbi:MAG: LodA/GoxA family CTQ-dependent oxidase [Pseudomonadota bacterium]
MALPPIYKIHPALGVARLGDANSFFIGPETPGLRPTGEAPGTSVPPYKDAGKIKPQAARFRVFEYVDQKGEYVVSREISLKEKDVTRMIWSVHLANRKASFFNFDGLAGNDRAPLKGRRNAAVVDRPKLDIDPRPRSIAGKNAAFVEITKGTSKNPASELWPNPKPTPEITKLGRLKTDVDGRLIVLGGSGLTSSITGAAAINNYANNDGWFDDVSDGPITVELQIAGKIVKVEPAWVMCSPPDFAPHLENVVSLYDVLFDAAARDMVLPTNLAVLNTGALKGLMEINKEFKKNGKPVLTTYKPDFETDIYPLLYRAAATMFLFQPSVGRHSSLIRWGKLTSTAAADQPDRQSVFAWLRQPDAKPTSAFPYMPKLLGDEPYKLAAGVVHQRMRLTVTPTQYAILEQWVKGNFIPSAIVPPLRPTVQNITPHGLDKAALENCVGGAMFPGIEVGWQIRDAKLFAEPFRIKHGAPSNYLGEAGNTVKAGHFTRQMALPWQADFLQCKSEEDDTGVFPGMGSWGWWPAQRPDWIFPTEADFKAVPPKPVAWHRSTKAKVSINWTTGLGPDKSTPSYQEMLDNWRKFGFIIEKSKNIYIEDEREADIP